MSLQNVVKSIDVGSGNDAEVREQVVRKFAELSAETQLNRDADVAQFKEIHDYLYAAEKLRLERYTHQLAALDRMRNGLLSELEARDKDLLAIKEAIIAIIGGEPA